MFREIILPIFRSTRLCVTACGVMHPPRCCRPLAGNIVGVALAKAFPFSCTVSSIDYTGIRPLDPNNDNASLPTNHVMFFILRYPVTVIMGPLLYSI